MAPEAFLGRLGLGFTLGVKGLGGLFSIRLRTSSLLGDFVDMPQPLRRLAKPGTYLTLKAGLAEADPELCLLALAIIAQWSMVERDFATLLISIAPGKAASIAEMLNAARADSPKKAIRGTLALMHLQDDEKPLFDAIQTKYEACYKLRNPLAHWTLGTCKQIPGVITACNPEDYIRITGAGEEDIDELVRDMADDNNSGIGSARISNKTVEKMMPTYQKFVDAVVAYKEKELSNTFDEISKLLTYVRHFRMIVRFRVLGLALDKRAGLLRKQYEQLGLSPPTGA